MKHTIILLLFGLMILSCVQKIDKNNTDLNKVADKIFPVPKIPFNPKNYVCYQTDEMMSIDGRLDETVWGRTEFTDYFVDIEGALKSNPLYKTRVKMLWDSNYFYIAAVMEEPHVWAKLTERDAVIFYDNDFEIFIDPDGDTHQYYELEVNALGTEWDLLLDKPYRDDATAIDSWDIQGLKTGIDINGSINNPSDTDSGWTVELAIPWAVLIECAHKDAPPNDGDQWRVNFSRVEWQTGIVNSEYVKKTDDNGKNLPESNWVWSPQGLIAMHYPEMWGVVQFSNMVAGGEDIEFVKSEFENAKWALRLVYYAEKEYQMNNENFADRINQLKLNEIKTDQFSWPPVIEVFERGFVATVIMNSGETITIDNFGHTEIR